jgi:parvulin-like peptidyl-prolyl isomerase
LSEEDPDFQSQLAKARKGAVDLLIETYVLQAAATDTILVATEEIERELHLIKSRHKNRESYEEGLRSSNLTEEEFKEILRKDIQIRKVMGQEAQEDVPIPTKEDARRFYEVNSIAFGWPYRVKFDEIVWPLSPEIPDASRAQAKTSMENLSVELQNSPELFNKVLIEASSTTWGYVGLLHSYETVDRLDPAIQTALETLVVGEVSTVIETPIGYSVIRITGTRESYESAEKEILQSIYDDAVAQNLEDWKNRQRKKHAVRICDLDYYEGRESSDSVNATGGEK